MHIHVGRLEGKKKFQKIVLGYFFFTFLKKAFTLNFHLLTSLSKYINTSGVLSS